MMDSPKLSVLVLSDVGAMASSNPFTAELVRSLGEAAEIERIDYGTFWLDSSRVKWDVILLQWPELLVPDNDTSRLDRVLTWLKDAKKNAKIFSVIHNILPHYKNSEFHRDLYRSVYEVSDAFIHLGYASVALQRQFCEPVALKPYLVVPHGNYSCFGPPVAQQSARAELGLPLSGVIILVFGELRAKEEFNFALQATRGKSRYQKSLVIAGRLPLRARGRRYGRVATYAVAAIRALTYFSVAGLRKNVILHERAIPHSEVAKYVCASDVLFIPRKMAINSGNVALGFTYGKVVVGPNIGNIGPVLSAAGNPVYDPSNVKTIAPAIERACELLGTELGAKNMSYALEKWSWDVVAQQLIEFFQNVRSSVPTKAGQLENIQILE